MFVSRVTSALSWLSFRVNLKRNDPFFNPAAGRTRLAGEYAVLRKLLQRFLSESESGALPSAEKDSGALHDAIFGGGSDDRRKPSCAGHRSFTTGGLPA